VRSGGLWRVPESFRLLLRSPGDVTVLRAASWWTFRHLVWLLGITAGILLIVLAWVVVLGRRLREQMAIIRQKLRSGAVLEERNRIARELHDTLEQELAGITMQLDLAADCLQQAPHIAGQALETARKMSRHSMMEARRSVWDLRCHLLENGDLVSALRQAVAPLALTHQVEVEVKVTGQPTRLTPPVEMNLLRIGQEAATNAVKHAHARNIRVELQYGPEKVRLCVQDDGRGFSPQAAALTGNGHFGLLDMRERAQSIGCALQIVSQPGRGTSIAVEVPVSPQAAFHGELKVNTHSGGG
jgi:signal transduction histidine kinase